MDKLNYDVVLFDLDGTLTDSIEGIVNAVCFACKKLGIRIPTQEELLEFIGPPMTLSFSTHFGLEGETLEKAIDYYHEYYTEKGWAENKLIDGIVPMLEDLKSKGKKMALCTNKPEHYAKQIMELFDIAKYMDFIGGSSVADDRMVKWKVIQYTVDMLGVDKSRAVMVGDRHYDVEGAETVGIKTIGVTFVGYGSKEELENAGAIAVVNTPNELSELF